MKKFIALLVVMFIIAVAIEDEPVATPVTTIAATTTTTTITPTPKAATIPPPVITAPPATTTTTTISDVWSRAEVAVIWRQVVTDESNTLLELTLIDVFNEDEVIDLFYSYCEIFDENDDEEIVIFTANVMAAAWADSDLVSVSTEQVEFSHFLAASAAEGCRVSR